MKPSLPLMAGLAVFALPASAGFDWNNGLEPNGFGLRDVSPPMSPEVRAVDDFSLAGFRSVRLAEWAGVEDPGWVRGELMQTTFYADDGGAPGAVIAERIGRYFATKTGDEFFGRDAYRYVAEFDDFVGSGVYWIGFRMPDATGTGTNYWLTSDGAIDGRRSMTGFFSLDGGNTWRNEGDDWHYAFALDFIIPTPGALGLLGMAGLCTRARRRA